ncbi:DegT/DnrJ/EryC1/StrS family aminotransferase [Candidatus Gottesmanbacteria bacterium]|nr:DegT/DnrJ/EryC1/StrS family aminotransferase [Candidatus Gottesmanbacteria bacterium]
MLNYLVPFNKVGKTAQIKKKEILSRISSIIDSDVFLNGVQNQKLKDNLSDFLGPGYICLTASGHDALFLCLEYLKLTSQDEIIFPANSYPAAFPVCLTKAKPVLVDVDKNGQIDPNDLMRKISKKTKAVIIVHLYGLVGNLSQIKSIAGNKITLIEDCAQALGSKFDNKLVGTIGDVGCFSFYPTKTISTLGDGGFIFTKNRKMYEFIQKAVSYGEKIRYQSEFISSHSRLPEIQAGILNVLFSRVNITFEKRKSVATYYKKTLMDQGLKKYIELLNSNPNSDPVEHLFVIKAQKRDFLRKYLDIKGIETYIHYPIPVHLVPAFSYLGYKLGDFQNSEYLSKQIISLPFNPYITKKDLNYVIESIKSFYA